MVVDQLIIFVLLCNCVGGELIVIMVVFVYDQDGNFVGLIGVLLYLFKLNFLGDMCDMCVGQIGYVYLVM